MNIGLGLVLIPFALIFISLGIFTRKKNDKIIGNGLLVVGTIILSVSVVLLTGLYDPYANHIR
ncbi:hypothetical protein [Bacillus bingmayongensis]|uniref:hypothetical protein n=1 Tax=Bacillus bingmayongensis TaxID=1150157 RepID=UPI0002E385B2|nr:hypothetical protein [Bacillus bingmayongensis]MBY0598822.1 hypothetical protein [Bacillus bingmayongensis]